MDTEERESRQEDESRSTDTGSNNTMWNNCWGPEIAEADQMMRSCPCASMFTDSRRSFLVCLAVAGLLFSITVAGWVLGVVAFFRTI